MLTEEQAKTKWCPLLRMIPATQDHHAMSMRGEVMSAGSEAVSTCIGSACMAWRSGVWDHQRNLPPEDRTPGVGYCGAFGKDGA